MSEVKRYYVDDIDLYESESPDSYAHNVVLASAYDALQAEVAQLAKERDELLVSLGKQILQCARLGAAQISMHEALKKYGRHTDNRCENRWSSVAGEWVATDTNCVCGLDAALRASNASNEKGT